MHFPEFALLPRSERGLMRQLRVGVEAQGEVAKFDLRATPLRALLYEVADRLSELPAIRALEIGVDHDPHGIVLLLSGGAKLLPSQDERRHRCDSDQSFH